MKIDLNQRFNGGRVAVQCENPCCEKGGQLIAHGWYPKIEFYYRDNYKIVVRRVRSRYMGFCSIKCLLQQKYGKRLINKIICGNIKK